MWCRFFYFSTKCSSFRHVRIRVYIYNIVQSYKPTARPVVRILFNSLDFWSSKTITSILLLSVVLLKPIHAMTFRAKFLLLVSICVYEIQLLLISTEKSNSLGTKSHRKRLWDYLGSHSIHRKEKDGENSKRAYKNTQKNCRSFKLDKSNSDSIGTTAVKVYIKRNQFFNILKVQHFKNTIPKFEPCVKKIGDSITPENCAILLSKMDRSNRTAKMSWWRSVMDKTTRLQYDTACIGYTQHQYPCRQLKIQRKNSIQNRLAYCFASETFLGD